MDWEEEADPFNLQNLVAPSWYRTAQLVCTLDPGNKQIDVVVNDLKEKVQKDHPKKK